MALVPRACRSSPMHKCSNRPCYRRNDPENTRASPGASQERHRRTHPHVRSCDSGRFPPRTRDSEWSASGTETRAFQTCVAVNDMDPGHRRAGIDRWRGTVPTAYTTPVEFLTHRHGMFDRAGGARRACGVRASLGALMAALLGSLLVPHTQAGAVGLTPMRVHIQSEIAGPGESFRLTVSNMGDAATEARFAIYGFWIDEDGGVVLEPDFDARGIDRHLADRYSGVPYIQGPEEPVRVEARSSREVEFTVTLPPSARGEYHALVVADAGPEHMRFWENAYDMDVTLRVGVFVHITPVIRRSYRGVIRLQRAAATHYQVAVVDLEAILPENQEESQTLKTGTLLENAGDSHVFVAAVGTLIDIEAQRVVERITFPLERVLVLPKSRRRVVGEFQSPMSPGTYRIRVTVGSNDPGLHASRSTQFALRVPLAGALVGWKSSPGRRANTHTLTIARDRRGAMVRESVAVVNALNKPIGVRAIVPPEIEAIPRIVVSPTTFVIPPRGQRVIRMRIPTDVDALRACHLAEIRIVTDVPLKEGGLTPQRILIVVNDPEGSYRR